MWKAANNFFSGPETSHHGLVNEGTYQLFFNCSLILCGLSAQLSSGPTVFRYSQWLIRVIMAQTHNDTVSKLMVEMILKMTDSVTHPSWGSRRCYWYWQYFKGIKEDDIIVCCFQLGKMTHCLFSLDFIQQWCHPTPLVSVSHVEQGSSDSKHESDIYLQTIITSSSWEVLVTQNNSSLASRPLFKWNLLLSINLFFDLHLYRESDWDQGFFYSWAKND